MLVSDFYAAINTIAPFDSAEDWDNVGLLIGDMNAEVTGVLLALDATEKVLSEALSLGANLIITHHPVIFDPLNRVTSDINAWRFIREGISVICAHSNLDVAVGGVNDVLAGLLSLSNPRPMAEIKADTFLGVTGELSMPMNPAKFAAFVKERLCIPGLRYADGGREILTVAVCGGSGADYLADAIKSGAQAYVTGECKHHVMLEAASAGITCIEAGHYETEVIVLEPLSRRLKGLVPGVKIDISRKRDIFYT